MEKTLEEDPAGLFGRHHMTDRQKETWDRLWSQEVSYHWDSLSQTIYETIHRYLGDPTNKALLEAGSGTGKISLRLAMEGANVTLVDYSEKALENSRLAFHRKNRKGNFILSDIRNMDVPDDAYDLTWNAGVLEHFDMPEKVSILREMARVTKPDGMIVVLTPFAKCLPYRVGKAFAEAHGFWMYGQEDPIDSLQEEFAASGITLLEEFSIGFVNSLDFLDFIPDSLSLKQWIRQWYEGLPKEEQSVFPGYLLVSVGKPERLLQRLDSLLKGERKRVLDVGAAYGTLLLYSVLWGSEGFGVDMTDAYWSSELEKEYPIKWARVNIEAEELPWSESFDVILFTEA